MIAAKVVIPSRYGSSRLPGKPLLDLAGKPMFWHVVQKALQAGFAVEDVVVATDDQRILDVANQLNIPAVLTSVEHASGTDRLNEVAEYQGWRDDTLVINVQGDEPLIPAALIRQLYDFTQTQTEFDIHTVISPLQNQEDATNPNIVKVALGENNRAVYFSRSPIPYDRENPQSIKHLFRHIGIYAYRVSSLKTFCAFSESQLEKLEKLEQLRALSNGLMIGATIIEQAPPHGIDTIEDYYHIKEMMNV